MSCGSTGGIFPGVHYVFNPGMYTMHRGPGDRVNHPVSRRDRGIRGRKHVPEGATMGLETGRSFIPTWQEENHPSACVACKANAARPLCGLERFACVVLQSPAHLSKGC